MSGDFSNARQHPSAAGYEAERHVIVDGRIVKPGRLAAERAHPDCEVCREIFERGWNHAMYGFQPSPYWRPNAWNGQPPTASALVERAGYEAYMDNKETR